MRKNTYPIRNRAYTVNMDHHKTSNVPNQDASNRSILAYFDGLYSSNYQKGETIINGVEEPKGIYLIKEGYVKAYSISTMGQSNLLIIHSTGDFIPLPWALDGEQSSDLYYEAMSNVIVIRSSKSNLRSTMGKDPWLSQEVFKKAVSIIESYTKRIQTLEFRTAEGKVISELLNLAVRFGKTTLKGTLIEAPITHQDIADSLNMVRETVSRTIEKLIAQNLIEQINHSFVLTDVVKLRAAVE